MKFFNDISADQPLSKLPYKPCVKSVSFGTSTEVSYQGKKSPDISCSTNDYRVTNLYSDANSIQKCFEHCPAPVEPEQVFDALKMTHIAGKTPKTRLTWHL